MPLSATDLKRRDKLVIRRNNIRHSLVTLKNAVDKHQADLASDPDALQFLVTRTERNVDHLGEITCDLIELEPEGDHAETQEMIEGEFCNLVTVARRLIRQRTIEIPSANNSTRNSPNPFPSATSQSMYTKLPDQTLPQFDGKYECWLDFKDDFESLVGKRPDLSDSQKLRYLRTSLKGEPARLLRQHGQNDASYDAAWKMLTDTFEHKNKILERHFSGIFDIPPLQKESPSELSELINTVQLHLSSLKALRQPVEHWSSILVHIVVSKLDKATRKDWKKTQKANVVSKYDDLITFLREAVLSADDYSASTKASRDEKPNAQYKNKSARPNGQFNKNQRQCLATTTSGDCPVCKESHSVSSCQQFRAMSPKEKQDLAIKAALCLNCLRSGHRANECTSRFSCRICKRKHHTWVHQSEPTQPPSTTPSTSQA